MSLGTYLRPGRRFLAAALSVTLLAMVGPVWAHPGEGEDGEEGKTFRYRVERADAKGGYLGVRVQDITRSLMKARDLSTDEGALVNRVEDESPADVAGMHRGDVIVEVDREKVADSNDLVSAVRDLEPGSKVDVVVLRDGLRKTLKVEVAKRPHDTMMGAPGFQGRGESGMDPDFKMMVPGPRFHQEMEELRQELDALKEELKELKQELRELIRSQSRSRPGSQSGS
ncbi:MAG: PDZ domain-containing protein [Candidatus Eisenbacteria bacterium]